MIKRIFNRARNSIWLYPAIYSLGAVLLSVAIAFIDKYHSELFSHYIHGMFYTSAALAQSILGIIATAFITIATFTFSTAMVVLTMYSSQFTPRVVENFLNNQTTMKSFGVFLSGFIYAITSLLSLNVQRGETLVLAAGVGVLYVIVGLVYFLIFVHSVSTYIQASGLIQRLYREAATRIRQYHEFMETARHFPETKFHEIMTMKVGSEVCGLSDGYIQEIDYGRLHRIAQANQCQILFRKVVGQFVSAETRIATVYQDMSSPLKDAVVKEIQQSVLLGDKRTEAQDFSFTIQKIVEIAVKALSPGVNDPNTAIHCLNILGLLMRDLGDIPDGYLVLREEASPGFVICEANRFETLLYDTYHQIIHYGRSDASVMIALLKSLRVATEHASRENRLVIENYAHQLHTSLKRGSFDVMESTRIDHEADELRQDSDEPQPTPL